MKVSNETKVGALAVIAITILILGFNFLKGKTFFSKNIVYFSKYENVKGLQNSNPVMINGMQVGTVYSIATDKDMKSIVVALNLTKDVNIPKNSSAVINTNPLGTTNVEIKLGDSKSSFKKNDTIPTTSSAGMFNEALDKIDPLFTQVRNAVRSLDSVLKMITNVVDPSAKNNIHAVLENLAATSASLTSSSASLNQLLNTQTGALAKTLNNVSEFTGNLAKNNEKVNGVMANVEKTSKNLASLDFDKTLAGLNNTIGELKSTIGKLNNNNGTVGMLLNDTRLYNNLSSSANKLNTLLDDLKTNPKRYLSISIFGKKDKSSPLKSPLPDSTNAPYFKVIKQ